MPTKRPPDALFQVPWTSGTVVHAELTATTTIKLYTVPAGKTLRIDRVWYNNVTGLAADATNAFAMTLQNDATVLATVFNTDSGDAGGAALAADTPVLEDVGAVLAAGDELTAVFTEDGTATLPTGVFIVEGRFV